MHGIGKRSLSCCQRLTLVHRRPEDANDSVDEHQSSYNAQAAVSTWRFPNTQSEGRYEYIVYTVASNTHNVRVGVPIADSSLTV